MISNTANIDKKANAVAKSSVNGAEMVAKQEQRRIIRRYDGITAYVNQ